MRENICKIFDYQPTNVSEQVNSSQEAASVHREITESQETLQGDDSRESTRVNVFIEKRQRKEEGEEEEVTFLFHHSNQELSLWIKKLVDFFLLFYLLNIVA